MTDKLDTVDLAIDAGIARLCLNRPDAANTLNVAMSGDILAAAKRCAADAAVRAVILSGAGKMFSGGGDIAEFHAAGEGFERALRDITANLHAAMGIMMQMNAPVVSALRGACAGGALGLALSADIVLASENARFVTAYTAIGMSADGGATYLLPRLIGLRRTQELFLTNRRLGAAEALELGLITEVVGDDALDARAEEVARMLADGPTQAYGAIKRLLATSLQSPMEAQMAFEARTMAAMASTADGREGIDAFASRRKPAFKGR